MKLTDVLRKIVDGSLMMRVSNPRTVSASTLHAVIDRIEALADHRKIVRDGRGKPWRLLEDGAELF